MSDFEGGRWIAAEHAVREAKSRNQKAEIRNEKIERLTTANYKLWVRKLGLSKPRGYTRFQAEYSNQVHQFDVSGSAYLEVVDDLGGGEFLLRRRSPRSRLSKKQKENRWRLWMIGVVDDYSGMAAVQYEVAAGEGATWVRYHLDKIWRGLDPRLMLRGLPEVLYCDNGPFARTAETLPYLSQDMGVGVELQTHEPYRSRSTGKMERQWRTIKSGFEVAFLAGRDALLLSELNRMVIEWSVQQQAKKHRLLDCARGEAWSRGLTSEVRIPADDALRNAFRTDVRTVDGSGVFTLGGTAYRVGEEFRSSRVLVFRNGLNEVVCEIAATGQRAIAELYDGPRAFGDYESFAETEMERTAKRREIGEWGEAEHPYSLDSGQARTPPSAGIAEHLTLIPAVRGEAKDTPFSEAARFADAIAAKTFVARELGMGLLQLVREFPSLSDELQELLNRTLDKREVAAWAESVRRGWEQQAVGGGQ
ncbi:MAG: hypothetical protein PHI18_07915, partial [bacterium]|nr:hypothetical protein [bacterium]